MKKNKRVLICILSSVFFLFFIDCSEGGTSKNQVKALEGVWNYDESIPWGINDEKAVFSAFGLTEEDFSIVVDKNDVIEYETQNPKQSWRGFPVKVIAVAFSTSEYAPGEQRGFYGMYLVFDGSEVSFNQVNEAVAALYGEEPDKPRRNSEFQGRVQYSTTYYQIVSKVESCQPFEEEVKEIYKKQGLSESLAGIPVTIRVSHSISEEGKEGDIFVSWIADNAALYQRVAAR